MNNHLQDKILGSYPNEHLDHYKSEMTCSPCSPASGLERALDQSVRDETLNSNHPLSKSIEYSALYDFAMDVSKRVTSRISRLENGFKDSDLYTYSDLVRYVRERIETKKIINTNGVRDPFLLRNVGGDTLRTLYTFLHMQRIDLFESGYNKHELLDISQHHQ